LEQVALAVDEVIRQTKVKYKEHNIDFSPYVFVKSDLGTYGMGVMSVQNGQELLELNKKARHSMQSVKYGIQNTELLIQEGIPTIEQFQGHAAETLAYVVDSEVVDLFLRVNEQKDNLSNLNSRGMQIVTEQNSSMSHLKHTLARLATLAVCFENDNKITDMSL
jgi:glutamate--cysteine ligase